MNLYIHVKGDSWIPEGEIHLFSSYKDYKEVQEFFSKNFDTIDCVSDEIGFPVKYFKCPKGSMFVRNEDGTLKES